MRYFSPPGLSPGDPAAQRRPYPDRLDAITRACVDGWNGEGSLAPTETSISRVRALLDAMTPECSSRCGIYPTPEGGMAIEWTVGYWGAEVVVSPDGSAQCDAAHCGSRPSTAPLDVAPGVIEQWIRGLCNDD